jgi:hypothetical protein
MRKSKNTLHIHQMSIGDFGRLFQDGAACEEYLMKNRWPEGVRCPRCANDNVHDTLRPITGGATSAPLVA